VLTQTAAPAIYRTTISHCRQIPVHHSFEYRSYSWYVDIDQLPRLPWWLRPLAGFRAADHLGDPGRSIKANVEHYLGLHGIRLGAGGRVLMLANARVLGHVFDPLTVFWCFGADGDLACVVAEVHNTYAERHVSLLRPDASGRASAEKEVYVSPFNDLSGRYEMRFILRPDRVGASITLVRDGSAGFTASFSGRPVAATSSAVARHVLSHPLMPQRVSALIRLHGIWLWLRRLPVARRPHHRTQEGV